MTINFLRITGDLLAVGWSGLYSWADEYYGKNHMKYIIILYVYIIKENIMLHICSLKYQCFFRILFPKHI